MPKNKDVKKVLVIGSGPITIGQAAEFDYSGTQACQVLREEGIESVLVNSNPATIMTDRDTADKVYIEPLTCEFVEKIIAKERPDSLIAGMGGQTGLNLAVELYDKGILDKYNVKIIGTSAESIKRGEDRELFKEAMLKIGQPVIESSIVSKIEEGVAFAAKAGYPVIVRPAYTLGGTGGGIASTKEELEDILEKGLPLSPVGQALIEKSVKGWKEIEYEVMRDGMGNCITVCNMENIDPVGIHTGDSIVCAPSQTLSDKEYQMLRTASLDIINEIGVQGGCNVQFALNPNNFEYAVIEINPRVSRSSALASKATGYPIARVGTKIALGYNLDEITNEVTGKTTACFEPALDYVVVKIPKWPFDKFYNADRALGTKMMATGEVMAIGANFEAALLKAIRSLEIGKYTLYQPKLEEKSLDYLKEKAVHADDERLFCIAEMLRRGYRYRMVSVITGIDEFFMKKIEWIVKEEEKLSEMLLSQMTKENLIMLKKKGFSDKGISDLIGVSPLRIKELKDIWGIRPSYKMVDTCAGEFEAVSPYYYSTYEGNDEDKPSDRRKIMVIGSGPIRIGQGIEFDYASVHCVTALRKAGIETIIVNNNPETVSTDFNMSDKLYFEPLTEEDVLSVIEKEKPEGVILQFGGQTAIKLANFLLENNILIYGTDADGIDMAEDREKFDDFLERLGIKRPKGKAVWNIEEGVRHAAELGYPVLVRPSYVLGGQGMEITHSKEELEGYLKDAFARDKKNPVLIDKYLMGREIEVDALCDGENILIPGIMEHLERAGVHSGDSMTLYPGRFTDEIRDKIINITRNISIGLKVVGMVNIQFIEFNNDIYIIEVNPRASRTVPYISKMSGVPVIDIAVRIMLGEKLKDIGYGVGLYKSPELVSIKVPIFSTQKLPKVEVSLGPEMKSTGEILGIGRNMTEALYKGFEAASISLSKRGKILVMLADKDKEEFLESAKKLYEAGFTFISTEGTAKFMNENGVPSEVIEKLDGDITNIVDSIRHGKISMVVNTPTHGHDSTRNGFKLRRTAVECSVPIFTSLDTVAAYAQVIEAKLSVDNLDVHDIAE